MMRAGAAFGTVSLIVFGLAGGAEAATSCKFWRVSISATASNEGRAMSRAISGWRDKVRARYGVAYNNWNVARARKEN